MSVRVKICGLTSLEDALGAMNAGADALGFMFYEGSPRHLTLAQAREILVHLPPFVTRVGVFVNPSAAQVREAIACGLDALQFHGEEPSEFCRQFGRRWLKAFRVRDAASLELCRPYAGMPWLLDSYVPGQRGGTGATFNWEIAAQAARENPQIILAGGLTPDNIAAALKQVRPYAVDASSGVESAPSKKEPEKVCAFIRAAKHA